MRRERDVLAGDSRPWMPQRRPEVVCLTTLAASLLLFAGNARADFTFNALAQQEDGSAPPAGTFYQACIYYRNFCPSTDPGAFPGQATLTIAEPVSSQPVERTYLGGAGTPVTVIEGTSVVTRYVGYYTPDSGSVTCAEACTAATKHWAQYGSVAGSVTLKNGMPLRDYTVVAQDPQATPLVSYGKAALTDHNGAYTFTSTSAKIYSFGFPDGMVDFPIPASNNWGLRVVQQAPQTRPTKLYNILAGHASVPVNVQSSSLERVDFVLPFEEADEDPPYKRCEGGANGSCFQDASLTGICVGKPVSILTGNMFFDQTDTVVGGSVPLVLTRSYNSVDAYNGRAGWFGLGWRSTYERELRVLHPGVVGITKANGNTVYFNDVVGNGSFTPYSAASGRGSLLHTSGSYVRTPLGGERETYDEDGRLVELADPSGAVTTLERDGFGRIVAVATPGGRRLTFVYSGSSPLVRALLGPAGRIATYDYSSGSHLRRATYADGSGYEYAYDDHGQLLEMRDLSGRVVESHEYLEGKAVSSEAADGVDKLTFAYEPNRTTVTDALGNVTHYDIANIDELKVITKVTGPCSACGASGSQVQEWTHDTQGRVLTHKNTLGETWSYTYDAEGNRDSFTDPLGRTPHYAFDARGRVLTVTPPGGGVRTYTYTNAGLASATDPLNRTLSIGYSGGDVTSLTDQRGKTTTFGRNAHGDLTSLADPLGHTTSYDVDAAGRLMAVTTPLGHQTTFTRDDAGRVIRVRRPTGAEWTLTYDKGGRRTSIADPLGHVTRYVYDNYGRLAAVSDHLTGVTTFGYDAMSNLTALIDAKGHATRFDYDGHQRLTHTTYPDSRFETYTYDAAGRPLTKTDRRGVVTTYAHDALGRLTGKSYSDGSPAVAYTYDVQDRLASASNGVDTLTWAYDDADRLLSETSTRNASTVSYTRDAAGRRLSAALDGTEWLAYGWDDASRLASLTRPGRVFGLGYDDDDRRSTLTYPNGVTTTYGFDAASRLTSILAGAGSTTLEQLAYAYDALDNRTRKSTSQWSETYGYDGLERLLSVERTGSVSGHWHFGYDAVGNRTRSQTDAVVFTATYDEANRLRSTAGGGDLVVQGQLDEPGTVTVNGQAARMLEGNVFEATIPSTGGLNSFTVVARDLGGHERTSAYEVEVPTTASALSYDPNGNLIELSDGSHTWTYEWTVENELARVRRDGAEVARFSYDALGRRVEKVAGGTTTRYMYDGMDILRESVNDGSATTTYRYVHGPGIDEPLARENAATGAAEFYHADGLGSIVKITDGAGAVVHSYRYDAWGNIEAGAERPGYAFTGREWDPEMGLYYYRARYYDPRLGRFISEDPLGFGAGVNLHSYVLNNPARFVDPFGLDIAVIENGPTQGNPIGHTAIAISGQGIYSSGNDTPPGSSTIAYLVREGPRRGTTVYVIRTTPDQDAAALSILKKNYRRLGIPMTFGNCSARSNEGLDAANIPDTPTPNIWPGSAGARALAADAASYALPKGSTFIPRPLEQFEPPQ